MSTNTVAQAVARPRKMRVSLSPSHRTARGRVLRNSHRRRVLRDQIIITERIRTSSRVAARTIISAAVTLILRSIIMDHRPATADSDPAHQTKESTRTPLSLFSSLRGLASSGMGVSTTSSATGSTGRVWGCGRTSGSGAAISRLAATAHARAY